MNGAAAGSETDTRSIPNASASLSIGQAEGLGFFDGRLDEMTVYSRALTAAELQAIADAGERRQVSRRER